MNKDSASADILRTKLYKPRVPKNYLHRSCLLIRLEKWVNRPMTLVCAPAGYGKSTLVSSWLDKSELPGAWISLGKNENDLRLFLSYMIAAVHTLFPESLEKTQKLLTASSLPHQNELLNSMVNEIDRIDQDFILVLDDYHLINNKIVHHLISEMIQYPPPNLHLILASRFDPPLGLSRLRARRQMGELRLEDLRLAPKEIQAFFEKELGIQIDKNSADSLNKKLEGWVTGLRLTALLLKGRSDINSLISNLPVDSRYISDYLISEVLHNLPEKIESFLLATSILHRFNASLCDAVCLPLAGSLDCRMGGINFIKWLYTSELFVIPLDDQGNW